MKISQIRNGTCTVWAIDADVNCPQCRVRVRAGTNHNCETSNPSWAVKTKEDSATPRSPVSPFSAGVDIGGDDKPRPIQQAKGKK